MGQSKWESSLSREHQTGVNGTHLNPGLADWLLQFLRGLFCCSQINPQLHPQVASAFSLLLNFYLCNRKLKDVRRRTAASQRPRAPSVRLQTHTWLSYLQKYHQHPEIHRAIPGFSGTVTPDRAVEKKNPVSHFNIRGLHTHRNERKLCQNVKVQLTDMKYEWKQSCRRSNKPGSKAEMLWWKWVTLALRSILNQSGWSLFPAQIASMQIWQISLSWIIDSWCKGYFIERWAEWLWILLCSSVRDLCVFVFFSVINFEADFSTLSHHDLGVWG